MVLKSQIESYGKKVIAHRVNIDFEFELFCDSYNPLDQKNRSFCNEFEFVYFFMEEGPLALSSSRDYSSEYIDFLELILGKKISLSPFDLLSQPWWGEVTNIEQERMLNSKITSFNISKKLNLLPKRSFLVNSQNELNALSGMGEKLMVKDPFQMSGRGMTMIPGQFIKERKWAYPLIIEDFHKVEKNIGVLYCLKTREITYIDLTHKNKTQFFGGKKISKPSYIDESIFDLIAIQYKKLGMVRHLQIDCYLYEAGMRYLLEVNHRKTMGGFILAMSKKFNVSKKSRGLYIENRAFKDFKEVREYLGTRLYNTETRKGIIPCSPPKNKKTWFFDVI